MAFDTATAAEIDKKLRDEFRRRLKDFGVSAEATDPVLAVLFRSFAGQLEALYSETERIRVSLLDELIAGLGISARAARPAQTVVKFRLDRGSQAIEAGTQLLGDAESGEKLTFITDASIAVSSATISFGATYQDGLLQLMPGVELSEKLQSTRPSLEPVRVNLGTNPAIFLAVEGLPGSHLKQHAFFIELGPDASSVQNALLAETWCLAGPEGEFGARGILRPTRINAGVRALRWLLNDSGTEDEPGSKNLEIPALPDGFYAGRIFAFPIVPPSRRFLCRTPRGLEGTLAKVFGPHTAQHFNEERAWLRISMPREISDLRAGITSVSLHAMSVSNVECFNQTIYFQKHGTSIPVSKEAGTESYLVAPLSVFGAAGTAYLPELAPTSDLGAGRYAVRSGRINLQPARHPEGMDSYANLRLWLTRGALGNRVGPGKVEAFLKSGLSAVPISNPTSAAGGTNGESFKEAQARFAEALLSRDRIVTRADLVTIVRAFDRRILRVGISAGLERTAHGLQRVQRVRILLDRNEFVDPGEEGRVLRDELIDHLRERFLYDVDLNVELEWK